MKTSERIHQRYKYDSQLPISFVRKRLPNLLARIRTLGKGETELRNFANKLKPIDINVLASGYPYKEEYAKTVSKVMFILRYKYTRIVGRRFWGYFQISPLDKDIIQMLVYIFNREESKFMGLKKPIRKKLNDLFNSKQINNLLKEMSIQIDPTFTTIDTAFKDWRIEKDSTLAKELWLLILENRMNTTQFVTTQGVKLIRGKLSNVHIDRYKQIIINYLAALNPEEYDQLLFTQLIDRLNDPRKNKSRWNNIPEQVIKKVKQRLIRTELYEFFDSDSERFNYWSKYVNEVEDVDFNEEPMIAAMYFGEFVVVEFNQKGNAAYFYEQTGFSKHLAHKLKRDINESELKDRAASYYIHKVNHAGSWPSRYDEYMMNFLDGNLNYKH